MANQKVMRTQQKALNLFIFASDLRDSTCEQNCSHWLEVHALLRKVEVSLAFRIVHLCEDCLGGSATYCVQTSAKLRSPSVPVSSSTEKRCQGRLLHVGGWRARSTLPGVAPPSPEEGVQWVDATFSASSLMVRIESLVRTVTHQNIFLSLLVFLLVNCTNSDFFLTIMR